MAETDDVPAEAFRIYVSEEKDVLDVTGNQLKDLADVDLPDTLTEIDLTTNRLSSIDPRIGALPKLVKLSLRQNLLTDATAADVSVHSGFSSLKVGDGALALPATCTLSPLKQENCLISSLPRPSPG